jgi:catechol 2,3-dioxygenase-like lactoylglutathione lyase family enzyme
MSLQGTSVVVVVVEESRLAEAVEFYQRAFGMRLAERSSIAARLEGGALTLWLHVGTPGGLVLQEFEAHGEPAADVRERLLALGCEPVEISGESRTPAGFLARDPFGMAFHIW